MRKKDLVLTKARSSSIAGLFPGVCSGPVATCHLLLPPLFYPSLCVTFPVFLSLVSTLQPSLSPELGSIRQIFNLGAFYFNF